MGKYNTYAKIDSEAPLILLYANMLVQAIEESISDAQEFKRAAKTAELKDKMMALQIYIDSYPAKLQKNKERTDYYSDALAAAEKKIASGTRSENVHLNLQRSKSSLEKLVAQKKELDTNLAKAEINLKKARTRIDNLMKKSILAAAARKHSIVFFPSVYMRDTGNIPKYTMSVTKRP